MYIESNDPEGAKVYDMIIRQILQDLVLPPSIDDMRAYVNMKIEYLTTLLYIR
jgi:hypothetical protein